MKTKLLLVALPLAALPMSARADDATTKHDRVAVSTTHTTSASRWNGASADDDADMRREVLNKHFTLAPELGWASNGFGAAVGGRVGYTFDVPVYVGASFVYQTGERSTSATWYPSGELGYDLGVANVLIRPYGGAGALVRQGGQASTGLVYPGVTAQWLIPRSYAFLGGDARLLIPLDDVPAVSLMGTAGLNF
ncbi:MAG TPA: hypothetical protein VIF62_22625 [Labilithrix sp.]